MKTQIFKNYKDAFDLNRKIWRKIEKNLLHDKVDWKLDARLEDLEKRSWERMKRRRNKWDLEREVSLCEERLLNQ